MFLARVVGYVWATAKSPELEGLRLLLVRPYEASDLFEEHAPGVESAVVVADVLGAGPGEDVVVAFGHAARVGLEPDLEPGQPPSRPIDAAVVAIVDSWSVESPPIENRSEPRAAR